MPKITWSSTRREGGGTEKAISEIVLFKNCNKIEKSLQTVFNDITRMSATFQRHRIYTDADERAFKLFYSLGS